MLHGYSCRAAIIIYLLSFNFRLPSYDIDKVIYYAATKSISLLVTPSFCFANVACEYFFEISLLFSRFS